VIEEADEAEFWLEFALDEKLFKPEQVNELIKEANELCNIFMASRKTIHNRKAAV
jgi:four helix bundle protein